MSLTDLFLHEELMLLTLRDREGTVFGGTNYPFAIGGAVLSELLLSGRIAVTHGDRKDTVRLENRTAMGDPLLDEWLDVMARAKRERTLQDWIGRIASTSDLKHRVALQLSRRGILRVAEDKVLWIFSRKIYPEVDSGPEDRLRARVEEALFEEGEVDGRTAVLVALAAQADILEPVFGRDRVKEAKGRLERIVAGELTAHATQKAIEAMEAALVITAAIPAIVTATIVTH